MQCFPLFRQLNSFPYTRLIAHESLLLAKRSLSAFQAAGLSLEWLIVKYKVVGQVVSVPLAKLYEAFELTHSTDEHQWLSSSL